MRNHMEEALELYHITTDHLVGKTIKEVRFCEYGEGGFIIFTDGTCIDLDLQDPYDYRDASPYAMHLTYKDKNEALGFDWWEKFSKPVVLGSPFRNNDRVKIKALRKGRAAKYKNREGNITSYSKTDVWVRFDDGDSWMFENRQVIKLKRMEDVRVPDEIDYKTVYGLSTEVREKLSRVRPVSLGQASRISGITPAALMAIQVHLKRVKTQDNLQRSSEG